MTFRGHLFAVDMLFLKKVVTGFILTTLTLLLGCQTTPDQPTLYPNSHLKSVGKQQAQLDIDECMVEATNYGVPENKDGDVGEKAVSGAIIGGVSAGAWGLVRGDAASRAAAGAAAGAAGGTAAGALETSQTHPTYKRFVQTCLADRGYNVIGWE